MFRKSSIWFMVLVSVIAIAFIASGCAKKQVVKEEAAAKPMIETKVEPAPAPPPPPPVEEVKPAPPPPPPREEPKKEAAPPAPKPVPIDLAALRIQFAFDDYHLSNRSKENLEKIASWLANSPTPKIQIQGNTCNLGSAEYNLALGERRASRAKRYFESL